MLTSSGTPALSRFYLFNSDTEWEWRPCLVLDCIPEKHEFLIQWVESGIEKYVSRFNVLFDAEGKRLFYNRIENAIKFRNAHARQTKILAEIDALYDFDVAPIPKSWVNAFKRKIGFPVSSDSALMASF